jgi:hypothetical protein
MVMQLLTTEMVPGSLTGGWTGGVPTADGAILAALIYDAPGVRANIDPIAMVTREQ